MLVAPAAQAADPLEVRNLPADRHFTPNGDGSEDIARVTYGLSQPATVDVTITDAGGTLVRKVLNHASQPESWNSSAFEWNGLDDQGAEAPEGQYTYTIRAEISSGATTTATGHIGIVRSIPAQLTAPAPGASLSGDAAARLVPTAGYALTSVRFSAYTGGSLSPPSVPKGGDGSYSYTFNSALMTNGANRVQANFNWRDAFNQLHSYVAEVPVTVGNPVRFSGLTRDAAFSPNGDGVEDTTTTTVQLANGDADITVRVLDADGEPVKTLFDGHHEPYVSLAWDGTTADGTPAPDGDYDIEIAATNAAGTTMTVRSVTIDTQVVGAFTAPAPGQSLIGTAHVAFVPRTGLNVNAIYYRGMCRSWQPYKCQLAYSGFADLDGTWGADIDTTRVNDGPNTLVAEVSFYDQYGTSHSWPVTLAVDVNNPVRLDRGTGSTAFTPDGDGDEDTTEVGYQITRDATADIAISTEGGTIIRHLDDVPATAPYGRFTWDGRDDGGDIVDDGTYTWTLTVTDPGGGSDTMSGDLAVVTAPAGTLTAPESGATLTGPFDITLEPAAGFTVVGVDFYSCENADWNCYVGTGELDADGNYAFTSSDEERRQGAWDLIAVVGWKDAFDSYHSYRTAALPITVTDPLKLRVDDEENAWFLGGDEFESSFRVNRAARVTATIVDDEGAAVRTLYDADAPAGDQSVTWDGLGDDRVVPHECEEVDPEAEEEPDCDEWLPGDPLPTGDYELRVTATDNGETVTATQPVRLERRPAGELVAPHDGDTLSRHQAFVVRVPDDYPEQPFGVTFCLADECDTAYRGDDGLFRTAIDTTGMENGEAELEYTVKWGWMDSETGWQVTRRWTGHASVTISDVAPEVTLHADPNRGDAPLASALRIDATDSVGTLDYTLNFGDGTPVQTGTIEPPYDELERPHTYTEPGVYHAHVMVTDQDGNSAQRTVEVVATAPAQPVPTTGTLAMRLTTAPAEDLGRFNLFIDSAKVKSGARNGQSSAPQTVAAGMHVVAMNAGAATTMAHYEPSIVCSDDSSGAVVAQSATGGSLNVPVAGGAHVVCTVLSTHLTAELAVRLRGAGSGTVTSSPAGLECSAPQCAAQFPRGSAVRLSAVPAPGSTFEGWEEVADCQRLGDCTVTMNGGRGVYARFEKIGVKAVGGEDLRGEEDSAITFDGRASRPVATISGYRWDFGDGHSATTARATHEYADPGRYTAKLTVTADGESDTDEVTVRVDERDDGRGLYVTIREENGVIGGADVVVNDSDGDRFQERTGGDGRARLRGLDDGRYSVYVNAAGYVPAVVHARVDDGTGTVTVDLARGDFAAVDVQTHELSEDEIRAAGIDPEDPDNQQVIKTEVKLCFEATGNCKNMSGYVGSGAGGAWYDSGTMGGGGGRGACWCAPLEYDGTGTPWGDGVHGGGYQIQGTPVMVNHQPAVVWMVMPIGGGFAKQFYEIKLLVTNLAPDAIRFEDGEATLDLPSGMSLAPTAAAQSLTMPVGTIPGGESRGVDWVVRGDAAGSYSPTVSYTGRLQPFDTPFALSAKPQEPIRIWGAGDALRVVVDADSQAVRGEPYRVRLGLRNISSGGNAASVYNPSVALGTSEDYVYQPRQRRSFAIDGITPGQTYWTDDIIVVPRKSGLLDVSSSVIANAAGDAAGSGGIVEHNPTRTYGFKGYSDGTLRWKAVPGATRYEVYSTPAGGEGVFPEQEFPGTPVAQSPTTEVKVPGGGGADKWYAVSAIVGGRNVMFHPITQATLPPDKDDDGVPDDVDNCPSKSNANQADKDDDGIGDACDPHDDRPDDPDDSDDDDGEGDETNDDGLGMPKPDPNCKGEHVVRFGQVEAGASCWEKVGADKYKSKARIRVGGMDIKPSGSGDIVIDTHDVTVKTTGSAEIRFGSMVVWRAPIDWNLNLAKTFKVANGAMLKGLPVTGQATIQLISTGVKVSARAGLPGTLGGVTGETELQLTNEVGLRVDKLAIDIPGFEIKGKLGVEAARLSYQRDSADPELGTWSGGAKILLPTAGLTRTAIAGYVTITDGALRELAGEVDGLQVLLGSGVFLQRLSARLVTSPFGFGGGAGISFGPQVMGNEAGSLDGKIFLTLEGANKYEATGTLRIAEVTMATGHATYSTGGSFEFGGMLNWTKAGVGVEGNIDGWVAGTKSFNAQGDANVKLPKLSFGGEALLSNKGMAACRRGIGPDAGFGYGWGTSAPHIFVTSCDVGPWVAQQSLARTAARGMELPAKLPIATFAFTGAGAPPRVTLTGPDGLKITTPAGGGAIDDGRVLLFQNPADSTTYVAVDRPAGGNWQVDTLPGSTRVVASRRANGLPAPQVSGRVAAIGAKRVLRYRVKPIAGQTVQFAERVPGGRIRVLGTARGARGSLTVKQEPGARGKRRIFAQVLQYGLPRDELAVASYAPPKSANGRVTRLRLTARRGTLKASWTRVKGAKAYRVAVRVSDGRRLLYLQLRRNALTITGVLRGMRATVQVRPAALPGGTPKATTKSIKVKR